MMIEDEELRNIYKIASQEHIEKIETGLLNMEKNEQDLSILEELLREAHSLKGDSRMLGVKDVETLIHQIEHILGTIKKGEQSLNADLISRLMIGLDAIRKLVNHAVTGEESGVNTFKVLAELMGANTGVPVAKNNEKANVNDSQKSDLSNIQENNGKILIKEEEVIEPEIKIEPAKIVPISAVVTEEKDKSTVTFPTIDGYKIETIRVETKHLDTLMTQTGELTVTKVRIAHRLNEMDEIVNLWEELTRDNLFKRRLNSENNGYEKTEEKFNQIGTLIGNLRNTIYEDTARLEIISNELEEGIRTLRLLPLSTIFQLYPRMVRDLAKQQKKEINLVIEGGETKADKRILEEMKDAIMHIIRNGIDHGIETPEERERLGKSRIATLKIKGYQTATNILIEISDDGRGLDLEKIKKVAVKKGLCRADELAAMTQNQIYQYIFTPGFSTRNVVTEVSGRGVGLDVVRTNVERLKGTILIESTPQKGCVFRMQLGITLATAHVLIVQLDLRIYALPVEFVQTILLVQQDDIFAIEGKDTILWNSQPISVINLGDLLELPSQNSNTISALTKPCIILQVGSEKLGIFVDELLDEQDVMLKPQSKILKKVRNVSGATILGTGDVCMVLNPVDMIQSVRKNIPVKSVIIAEQLGEEKLTEIVPEVQKPVILLVEDSIATRTQEKRILENAGYEVITAVDGLDGFNKLKTRQFSAIISDIQMPNMDGLTLTTRIRQQKEYNEVPIILVTSLASDEDKRKGAEAGANAYITKNAFNQEVLIDTLRRLI